MRPFYRLSGGGNDFLAFVEPASLPTAQQIGIWCRRGLSVGADGLFILERRSGGARMRYFNADGRPAELCLNGTRCAVALACHLGWSSESIEIETDAGTISGHLSGSQTVALGLPPPREPRHRSLELGDRSLSGWQVEVGVPHFVLNWSKPLDTAPVAELGPLLRTHVAFAPAGANIDFVRFLSPHRLEIRSYERGVEAETLACGTGVMAATAAGLAAAGLELPVRALTLGGFELEVDIWRKGQRTDLWCLTGDARLVCEGSMLEGADQVPPPPRWS